MNDVVIEKVQSIQRCVRRAREEYRLAGDDFAVDYTRQDAAVLNVTRACEQAIDLANHVIKQRKLGVPATSADAFDLLSKAHVVSEDLAEGLKRMVGIRNVAIHPNRDFDIKIVEAVITSRLDDLVEFTVIVVRRLQSD